MSEERDLRLAVLIDADNAPRSALGDVMAEVAVYGTPTIKRIYGDWTTPNLASWKPLLLENAITPVQQYGYTTGKNSTDSAMIIDAMDILYTGQVDELFGFRYGRLPYRTLDFRFETHPVDFWQSHGTVNYTVDQDYTRITEFKYLTGQELPGQTTIMKEYSRAYTGAKGEIPYYAIINAGNNALYAKYRAEADRYPNFHLLGRLAEYKYYNMDAIAARALELCDDLLK